MTPDEAIRRVKHIAELGGDQLQRPFAAEVLVQEIERLREAAEIDQLALIEVTRQLCERIDQETHNAPTQTTTPNPTTIH